MSRQERVEGRTVFGRDPAAYDRARPPYPERVFAVLRDRCGLREGTSVLELGPGPGTATKRLLELGAGPLVAIEPNAASAEYLIAATDGAASVIVAPFEEIELEPASFDLAVAATSFHWIDPEIGLPKVREVLRPGGWFAIWANVHGDQTGDDAFHRATSEILGPTPDAPWPSSLDSETNVADLVAAGFSEVQYELIRSTMRFESAMIRALYGTFSGIARRGAAEREAVLDALERIAATDFGGGVERAILTPLYTGRKR